MSPVSMPNGAMSIQSMIRRERAASWMTLSEAFSGFPEIAAPGQGY